MKKYFSILLAVALVTALFVSCDFCFDNQNSGSLVDYKLKVVDNNSSTKALSITNGSNNIGTTVAFYTYTATCTSSSGAQGTQSDQKELSVSSGSATLEKMAPGSWTITVYAYNSSDWVDSSDHSKGKKGVGLLLKGVLETTISSDASGTSGTITCKPEHDSTNKAEVSITVGAPTITNATLDIKYATVGNDLGNLSTVSSGTAGYDADGEKSGWTKYTKSYTGSSGFAAGNYIMQILYKDASGKLVAGQMLAFRAVGETPVTISGNFQYGEFVDFTLTVDTDDPVLNVSFEWDSTNKKYKSTTTHTDNGTTDNIISDKAYTWYLDGSVISGATSANYTPANNDIPSTGTHILTLVETAKIDSVAVIGYYMMEIDANGPISS